MSESSRERVFQVVQKNILLVLDAISKDEIRDDVRLVDLGANSLDRVDIVSASMQDLALKFPLRELGELKNIGGLVDALAARLGGDA